MVYDLVHQILNGKVESEINRDLIIALFRDARLMHRIVNGQKVNDEEKCVTLYVNCPIIHVLP